MQDLLARARTEGFTLEKAILTSFDFDDACAEKIVNEEDAAKFLFVHGDGLFHEKEGSEIIQRRAKIAYPLINDKIASKYFHAKVGLALGRDSNGEKRYLLHIGSKNIYPFENIECGLSFMGRIEQGKEHKNSLVLREFLSFIAAKLEDNEEVFAFIIECMQGLESVAFLPMPNSYLGELARQASSFELIGPSCIDIGLFQEDYEEVLVISPNISGSLLSALAEKCHVTVATQPLTASNLLLDEVKKVNWVLPKERYLHAKMYLGKKEDGSFDLYLGSMNLTEYAYTKNDEFMVCLKGIKDCSFDAFLRNILGSDYDEESREGLQSLPEVLYEASLKEKRSAYLGFLLKRKHYDESARTRLGSFLLSSSCPRLLLDYCQNGLPPFTYKEKRDKNKVRPLYVLDEEGKTLFGLINYCLHRYDNLFSSSVYLHVGTRNITNLFSTIRRKGCLKDYYLFRTDIHAFDPSISEELLVSSINDVFSFDTGLRDFLLAIAKKKEYRKIGDSTLYHDAPAQKTGFPLAGLMENVVLADLDKRLEESAPFYARFGDDILIASKDEEEIKHLKELVVSSLEKKGLFLSAAKSHLLKPGETCEFLGLEIANGQIDIAKKDNQDIQSELHQLKKRLIILFKKQGIPTLFRLRPTLKYVQKKVEQVALGKYFSCISTSRSLHQIDEAIVDALRTIVTGKEGKGRFRLTYQDLQRYGYRSLVNRYYDYIKTK